MLTHSLSLIPHPISYPVLFNSPTLFTLYPNSEIGMLNNMETLSTYPSLFPPSILPSVTRLGNTIALCSSSSSSFLLPPPTSTSNHSITITIPSRPPLPDMKHGEACVPT
jgi:hypothetical protein